jgi:hypothetical protein
VTGVTTVHKTEDHQASTGHREEATTTVDHLTTTGLPHLHRQKVVDQTGAMVPISHHHQAKEDTHSLTHHAMDLIVVTVEGTNLHRAILTYPAIRVASVPVAHANQTIASKGADHETQETHAKATQTSARTVADRTTTIGDRVTLEDSQGTGGTAGHDHVVQSGGKIEERGEGGAGEMQEISIEDAEDALEREEGFL